MKSFLDWLLSTQWLTQFRALTAPWDLKKHHTEFHPFLSSGAQVTNYVIITSTVSLYCAQVPIECMEYQCEWFQNLTITLVCRDVHIKIDVFLFQYYCEQCWANIHSRPGREFHKPLVKEGADRPRTVPFRWCWKPNCQLHCHSRQPILVNISMTRLQRKHINLGWFFQNIFAPV